MAQTMILPGSLPEKKVQPPMVYIHVKPAWEYKVLTCNLEREKAPDEAGLNALGAQGWELVGIFSDSPFVFFYFKRLGK